MTVPKAQKAIKETRETKVTKVIREIKVDHAQTAVIKQALHLLHQAPALDPAQVTKAVKEVKETGIHRLVSGIHPRNLRIKDSNRLHLHLPVKDRNKILQRPYLGNLSLVKIFGTSLHQLRAPLSDHARHLPKIEWYMYSEGR